MYCKWLHFDTLANTQHLKIFLDAIFVVNYKQSYKKKIIIIGTLNV